MGVKREKMPIFCLPETLPFVIIPKSHLGGPKMPLDFSFSEGIQNHKNILGSHTKRKMILLKFTFQSDYNMHLYSQLLTWCLPPSGFSFKLSINSKHQTKL